MRWITSRDKEVLKFIYFHRYSSTSQICNLFFKFKDNGELQKYPDNITRRRLKKFRDEELIKSFYTQNTDMIHTIDEKGVMIVASILGTTFNKLYFSKKDDLLSIGLADHSLKLNDLYIKLLKHAKRKGGDILEYKVERLNRIIYYYEDKKYIFQPDAHMLYIPDVKERVAYPYFIELDLNTETPKQYSSKIESYEKYFLSQEYQNQYKIFPKIVTITTHQTRADRLKDYCKTMLNWDYLTYDAAEKILNI